MIFYTIKNADGSHNSEGEIGALGRDIPEDEAVRLLQARLLERGFTQDRLQSTTLEYDEDTRHWQSRVVMRRCRAKSQLKGGLEL